MSDDTVKAYGLTFGGLVSAEPVNPVAVTKEAFKAACWALATAAAMVVPLAIGWSLWSSQRITVPVGETAEHWLVEFAGQLLLVALPEEAFYRGYVQSRLDVAWPPRRRILGASCGPSILLASVLFAIGHILTEPDLRRLVVFLPSLVFGWLRARTGGIGASMVLHALCNTLSRVLGSGWVSL